MTYIEVTNNHLKLLKDTQDHLTSSEAIQSKTLIWIAVWSASAICNALLAIAVAIEHK